MKRNEFITKMLVGVPLLLIPRKPVAAAPVTICIYVRIDNSLFNLKFAGCFNITFGSQPVTINILDTRPNPDVIVQRQARDENGNLILASNAVSFNSTETLP